MFKLILIATVLAQASLQADVLCDSLEEFRQVKALGLNAKLVLDPKCMADLGSLGKNGNSNESEKKHESTVKESN